ncbi:MAG: KaiC domain-containing protein [Candidatus Nezhaarchaeota archaeon]|nr:KaiC domain-containing protein [Candidatus Nezhaarchaeota archaeon]MCX8141584.1 KaiC domain-containing protein [Candidatus Nezhaarchaeota archaeon]MDW8049851.1 KaiC domain-containing protein [Nitrososphaerota archaeon]
MATPVKIERVSTGIPKIDEMLAGGIPRGFAVALTGEPGTGKTVFCIHFIAEGLKRGEKGIFVTTEESRSSIMVQASQFGFNFKEGEDSKRLIIIDALMKSDKAPWTLTSLNPEELVEKVIEAKKYLGYGPTRLVIDSLSAFWLDAPAMARKHSYFIKRVLTQWDLTILMTSQYAITTSEAFGFGVEHVADGIIRFRKSISGGVLKRFIMIEKMRWTPHDKRMYEIDIVDGKGLVVIGPTQMRKEDVVLPRKVTERILRVKEKSEEEVGL